MTSSSSRKRRSNLQSESELLPHQSQPVKKPKSLDKDLLREQTGSSLRLANQVFSTCFKTPNQNAVLSPLSIQIALSMVAAGASGLDKEEIVSFLGANSEEQLNSFASNAADVIFSDSSASGGPTLSAVNAFWLSHLLTFKSTFKQTMESNFKAVTKRLDFTKVDESVREVNEWAKKATNGLINSIVNTFDWKTVLVLANAVYFKGSWVDNFHPESTEFDDFHLMNGGSVRVPFMTCTKDRAIGTYDTFKVLNLPYRKGRKDNRSFSMSIFLPNDRDGLPSLLERVCTDGSSFLDRYIPKTRVKVGEVKIPKLEIDVNFSVKYVLEQLGLEIGNLREIIEEKQEEGGGLIVSDIVQKAYVEVYEEGTKAAAVTAVFFELGALDSSDEEEELMDFIADHPFMFVIREDSTGLVLFVGRVLAPSS